MSKARQDRLQQPPPPKLEVVPPTAPPARHAIGPATLDVFAQILANHDVSKSQIVTMLEAKGLLGSANYKLVVTGAYLEAVS